MKFKYYVTDLYSGSIKGINDDAEAPNIAECEDFFVVDSTTGEWLIPGGERVDVEGFEE